MSATIFSIFALLLVAQNVYNTIADNYDSSYYNHKTNGQLQGVKEVCSNNVNKFTYSGVSCSCQNQSCSCCVGVRIKKLNFDKEACIKITYKPQNSVVTGALTLNEKEILSTGVPVKNPLHLCVPIPKLSMVKVCLIISDISINGNKLQACPHLETNIASSTILTMHFNCLRI